VDDRIMGNSRRNHRRVFAQDRDSGWGNGEFLWTIQCAADELLSPASGNGERRAPASRLFPRVSTHGRALGRDHRMRRSLRRLPRNRIRSPDHARHIVVGRKLGTRVLGFSHLASARAWYAEAIPCSRRHGWSRFARSYPYWPARFGGISCRTRADCRH
jgi:hypothetical protein